MPDDWVVLLDCMIDEVQAEARHAISRDDAIVMYAKRDALSELRLRLTQGLYNPHWARSIPSMRMPWKAPAEGLGT